MENTKIKEFLFEGKFVFDGKLKKLNQENIVEIKHRIVKSKQSVYKVIIELIPWKEYKEIRIQRIGSSYIVLGIDDISKEFLRKYGV